MFTWRGSSFGKRLWFQISFWGGVVGWGWVLKQHKLCNQQCKLTSAQLFSSSSPGALSYSRSALIPWNISCEIKYIQVHTNTRMCMHIHMHACMCTHARTHTHTHSLSLSLLKHCSSIKRTTVKIQSLSHINNVFVHCKDSGGEIKRRK